MPSRDRRLRVLVVPERFPSSRGDIGGIFVRDYIEAIRSHCDVAVLLSATDGRPGLERSKDTGGIDFVRCTPRLRGAGASSQKLARIEGLYRLGRTAPIFEGTDIVHAHGAVFHGLPAVRIGRRLGVPVVLTVHTGPFNKVTKRRTTRFLARRTIEAADCVCPVSEHLRRQIEEAGMTPKRVAVTNNPVDTELFRLGSSAGTSIRRIVFAGRLEEYKGALRVVRAFGDVADRLPGWSLTVAGDGPELTTLKAFLDARPALAGRVELIGRQTKVELANLFSSAAFLVYPSRHESFGLVIAEAMAAGLPVVAPDQTAPPEFVDERSGVLVPPDDVAAIGRAIIFVAQHGDRFDRTAIRERVVERFGLAAFGRRLVALYEELVRASVGGEPACAG
jgi:glycosyltransferase involved in cell wall biosynthesis